MKAILLLGFMFISSCADIPMVSRDSQGMMRRNQMGPGGQNPLSRPYIKKKVALLTFFNEAPVGGDDLAIHATEELRRLIARTPEYIVDPTAENIFGVSRDIYSGGGTRLPQMSKQAKVAGMNLVIYGRIKEARVRKSADEIGLMRKTKAFSEVMIEIRVFDVHSAKEIWSDVYEGVVDDQRYRFFLDQKEGDQLEQYRRDLLRYGSNIAVRRFVPKFVELDEKLNWVGRVARIIGNKIYLNAGRESGINIGDILRVITEGQDIFDPQSGAWIGVSRGETKGTIEIIDFYGPDGAVAVLHSGGVVTEGDFVELY